jgi:tRNA threonylcarbamoyladenosine biosynthesis protein TsaE
VPILKEGELDIISHSVEQTLRLGARLGSLLEAGDILCLSGDMGAGKTVFSAGIGQGWGAKTPVTSPTFNLIHIHTRDKDSQQLYHLDCYRLNGAADADSIGLDEVLVGRGPVIFEWPEHIDSILPPERLWIELRILEQTRRNFIFEGVGPRYEALVKKFRELAFGI